jgi:ribose 5-phosphate isomerase A
MDEGAIEAAKRRAGERAAEAVEDGDVVGLGTGSTAGLAIGAIGRRIDAGLEVRGVPTSTQSAALAREVGIALVKLADATPDLAIDGADQVADGSLLKGGGAAHAREKVVATAADEFCVVVDATKLADRLDAAVPLEVLEVAVEPVIDAVAGLGGEATLRGATRKDGAVITDNGNPVLDADFGPIDEPGALAADLAALPGLVAHGLFVDTADVLVVGDGDGVQERPC